ncbi:hypothetical protein INT45_013818 [Circinella minor]|uniref:Uncharacterized protein n=1 Tax=Circinella minor TaxID=1195481 RepID=A0A8H7RTC2_9FUNG|nr:hypothetical protein INT45_013818 [Circinella minor]
MMGAYVLDTKFDLILERNWLKTARDIPDLTYLLSHRQVQRLERHKEIDNVFLWYVHPGDIQSDNPVQSSNNALVKKFRDVFQDTLPGLPPDRDVEHVINTGDADPISRPPYKMSPLELTELRKQIRELLDLRLIRLSLLP